MTTTRKQIKRAQEIATWVVWVLALIASRWLPKANSVRDTLTFCVLAGGAAVRYLVGRWQREAAYQWIPVPATAEFCTAHNENGQIGGKRYVHFSYSFEHEYYASVFSLSRRKWENDPVDALKSVPIQIRVNPNNPNETLIDAASVPGLKHSLNQEFIVAEE